MCHTSSQCKICYKICDLNEFLETELEQSEEDRRKMLNICSEYLFRELCDWKSISCEETLPFCVECFGVIAQIEILDEKCKVQKSDISNFSEKFAVEVLRLRNRRKVEEFPKIIGGVQIKIEKGLEEEFRCKICRGTYNEKSMWPNESLAKVATVIRTCQKYLFVEIFDGGSLDMHFIASDDLLQFCSDCCIKIQHLCQKSNVIDNTTTEIEKLVNTFAVKILNYRKTRKVISDSGEVVINVSLVPPNSFQDTETPAIPVVEESKSDDDDCMIVDVIPAGVRKSILNSLCNKLRVNNKAAENPGEETHILKPAFPDRKISIEERLPINKETKVTSKSAGWFAFPEIAEKLLLSMPIIEPNANKEIKSNGLSGEIVDKEKRQSTFSEHVPGLSVNRSVNRQVRYGSYKCENCGAIFMQYLYWQKHMDSCSQDINDFLAETELPDLQPIQKPAKPYKCSNCNRSFVKKSHLNSHLRGKLCGHIRRTTHSRKRARRPYRKCSTRKINTPIFCCRLCPQKFTIQTEFTTHLRSHYDIASSRIRCDICRKVFSKISTRNIHFRRRHPDKIQKIYRNRRFYYVDKVDIPSTLEPEVNSLEQDRNNLRYSKTPTAVQTKETYTERTPKYFCTTCRTKFYWLADLRIHLQEHLEK